jgi:hypothetical protein
MNATSRLTLRTKIILGFLCVLGLGTITPTAVEAIVAEPQVEITFSHYETNQNVRSAVINIRNVGGAAAIYWGYSTNSPRCDLEYRTDSGEWSGRLLRCGTGLRDLVLLPGAELRAKEYLADPLNWRVGFPYRKASFQDGLPSRIRSLLPYVRPTYRKVWTTEMSGDSTFPRPSIACEI